jgi:hypothetical protein
MLELRRVGGAQAEGAKSLGLVKIIRASAKYLFNMGVPLVIVGNKVGAHAFFKNWHLAFNLDSQRYLDEGVSFESMVNNWSHYNENPETGTIAFFVAETEL